MKYERINQNSLAQFMRTRERVCHVSKPLATVMVPAGPWPGAPMVQKAMLGAGVTYKRDGARRPRAVFGSGKAGVRKLKRALREARARQATDPGRPVRPHRSGGGAPCVPVETVTA